MNASLISGGEVLLDVPTTLHDESQYQQSQSRTPIHRLSLAPTSQPLSTQGNYPISSLDSTTVKHRSVLVGNNNIEEVVVVGGGGDNLTSHKLVLPYR